jgi:glycosyltransferase involved in cell wall biosynthesis
VESYDDISRGDSSKIIYLGKADFRKADGLDNFLKEGWPKIRSSKPHMEFHLAGQNTEVFHQPENNIYGYGFVEDPKEFLGKGLFFINPQTIGSGVKIKSLVALASQKVLITTSIGVEGIEGKNERDYVEENSYEVLANKIVDLSNDKKSTELIRQNAFNLVKDNYSNKKIITEATPSLEKDLNINNA